MGLERRLAFMAAGILAITSCVSNKEPQTHYCSETLSGIPSEIGLPLGRTEFGAGIQTVKISNKLSEQPNLSLNTTDKSCTRTTVNLNYLPDRSTLAVGGNLYYPDQSTHPYLWQGIDLNYYPDPEDELVVYWTSWKVTKVAIGEKELTLFPPPVSP